MSRTIRLFSVLAALLVTALAVHAVEDVSWGALKSTLTTDNTLAAAKKAGKVSICHYSADEGQFHLINISGNAVDKHSPTMVTASPERITPTATATDSVILRVPRLCVQAPAS